MAVQNPFFGKRDNESSFATRNSTTGLPSSVGGNTSAGLNSAGVGASSSNPLRAGAPSAPPAVEESSGSKLTVGPNIKLKGVEITDCDTLVVEGTVEASMNSRVIKIAEQGAFHGTAEIDIAEIRGKFDGTLTVREKLVIYGTGKVSGKIRYGKVVIEEGGELTGQIEAGSGSSSAATAATAKPSVSSVDSATTSASGGISAAA